ncbi:unnamed protein product, partial [Phaeothamnion confervicola]
MSSRGEVGLLGIPYDESSEDEDWTDEEEEANTSVTKRQSRSSTRSAKKPNSAISAAHQPAAGHAPQAILGVVVASEFLTQASKLRLQETCRAMCAVLDDPSAWQRLDLGSEVVGWRKMQRRRSRLSLLPMFMITREVVQQARFRDLASVSLEGQYLGVDRQPPDLLLKLFTAAPRVERLNLLGCRMGSSAPGLEGAWAEMAVVEGLSRLHHLAIEITTNKGLQILMHGCRELRSLHILGAARDAAQPNDAGFIAAFRAAEDGRSSEHEPAPTSAASTAASMTAAAAPAAEKLKLTTLTLHSKNSVGVAGLSAVLRSCRQLESLEV